MLPGEPREPPPGGGAPGTRPGHTPPARGGLRAPPLRPVLRRPRGASFSSSPPPPPTSSLRLDHRHRVAADLLRPRPVLRQARGQEHVRVLRVGPLRAVVAGRPLDGRDDVQQRHAELGDAAGPPIRRGGQLAVVGVRAHGRLHGVLLRPAVAALRRDDGSRVLRVAVLRQGRVGGARLPRGLSRPVLQLLHHGHGDAGGVQDRQHPLRDAAMADDPDLRRAQRGVRRALRPVGRARHRHGAVLDQDDRGHRGGVFQPGRSGAAHRRRRQRARRACTSW